MHGESRRHTVARSGSGGDARIDELQVRLWRHGVRAGLNATCGWPPGEGTFFLRRPRPSLAPYGVPRLGGVVEVASLPWRVCVRGAPRREPQCKNRLDVAAGGPWDYYSDASGRSRGEGARLQTKPLGMFRFSRRTGREAEWPYSPPVVSSRSPGPFPSCALEEGGKGRGREEGCCMPGCKCNPPTMCLPPCAHSFRFRVSGAAGGRRHSGG